MADPIILWPATLPLDPLIQGYDETIAPGSNVLRSPMDTGPAKTRRRFSANVRPLTINLPLTRAQVQILEDFIDQSLGGGALAFQLRHPRKLTTVSMRILPPVKAKPVSGNEWTAPLNLEILP